MGGRSLIVTIARRELLRGAARLGCVGFALSVPASAQVRSPVEARAVAELMQPGPLEEMTIGDPNAPVTIIEYASMTCPHCAHFEQATYPELKRRYIDTGKVRLILREFPLDPLATAGFMLARCAGKDRFFPFVEILFRQQGDWLVQNPIEPLLTIAKQQGFTEESFHACLGNEGNLLEGIEAVRQRANEKFGVNSTPTFFINGRMLRGDHSLSDFEAAMQPFLKG
jgi:protein-disulfide isomerase